ncbi:MAG: phosphatidylserine decarboxylase, partial [Thermoleophilaceae bacterium]
GAIATAALAAGGALGVRASRVSRDPERSAPDDPRAIVSPADGRVIYVKRYATGRTPESEKVGRTYVLEELDGSALARDEAIVVGIAMDFLDVHVNRAPLAGTVALRRRCPGRFASLKRPEAALENERVTTLFAGEGLELAVVQIASRLVRRIVSFVGEGDRVAAGDRIGVIRLGSQVDVVMPARAGLTLQAAPGDRVAAGTSVLAAAAAEGVASRESPEAVA